MLKSVFVSRVGSQVQRMWWWRSHGQRRRIDDSDPGSHAPHPTPTSPIPPCTWSTPPLNSANTTPDELRRGGEGMPERDWRGWGETRRRLPDPPPGLFHPDSSSYESAHHYPEMHSSRSLRAEALATGQSVKTLRLCGWLSLFLSVFREGLDVCRSVCFETF